MGGLGSGRFGQRTHRLCVEQTLPARLDPLVRRLRNARSDYMRGSLEYLMPDGSQMLVAFTLSTATARPFLTLSYEIGRKGAFVSMEDSAPLTISPVPHGRRRWRLLCPSCQRRCDVLYLPLRVGARFACRRCHRLAYRSQRISLAHRWQQRADRLFARVGTTAASVHIKPKGMRWATFERILAQATDYDSAATAYRLRAFLKQTDDFVSKLTQRRARC